ncbi:nitroreductase family protein [Paraliomyxa miuraensis]|uniref:nitroreductase family protein n=1 Tax=Paraliomyxa miuraensis TaxID=376150 RepID=UPI002252A939|nr:nitroreductase family protein [Paraliomyxa miuraensis]MCX4239446.1 nitroreductase family protein [Paraliomyxa miuraensis]
MAKDSRFPFVPYRPARIAPDEALGRGRAFLQHMDARRSVRQFSDEPVPREAIELAIRTASTAPSGAHRQPWRFVVVDDPELKHRIRMAAEQEERQSYEGGRMSDEWLEALAPLGTDWHKPYLETVPYLVVVFEEVHGHHPDGRPRKNFYVRESVGLACGLFVAALHTMGLCTLTHTPSPMGFLREILGRPKHERPYILFPVGYAAADAEVPELKRKSLDEVMLWNPRAGESETGESETGDHT